MTWQEIVREASFQEAEHFEALKTRESELRRVANHFGWREAMEFAASEHEIPILAFLAFFEMLDQGEKFGAFAL